VKRYDDSKLKLEKYGDEVFQGTALKD